MNKPKLLIIGASGKIGSELVSLLNGKETPLRVLVRSESSAQLFENTNVEIAQGDLSDEASLQSALTDILTIFLLTRDHPQQAKLESDLIELAAGKGVKKIVKSSAYAAGLEPPVGYGIPHAAIEQKLISSGLQWTILRPYMFMQNLLELAALIKTRGVMPLPMGKAKISLIDARDVALVASKVLLEEEHNQCIYELTGPESLTMSECAETLSTILERSVVYRAPPYWVAGLMMRLEGVSGWDISMRKQLFRMIREGGEAKITNDVQRVTGQKPRSFATFVQDHKNLFE